MPILLISIIVWPSRDLIRDGAEAVRTRAHTAAATTSPTTPLTTIQIRPPTPAPFSDDRGRWWRSTAATNAERLPRPTGGHAGDDVVEVETQILKDRLNPGSCSAGDPGTRMRRRADQIETLGRQPVAHVGHRPVAHELEELAREMPGIALRPGPVEALAVEGDLDDPVQDLVPAHVRGETAERVEDLVEQLLLALVPRALGELQGHIAQ